MKTNLNPRQAAVVSKMVKENKSATQAYAEVYPVANSETARSAASRMLANVNVQNALEEALREEGIDEQSIAKELVNIRKSWDWRAKEAYVKNAAKFLGYDKQESAPQAPVQVGNIVNNWAKDK